MQKRTVALLRFPFVSELSTHGSVNPGRDGWRYRANPCSTLHACLPNTLSYLLAHAGAPVYFCEFRHQPQCLKDMKPSFTKADHSDDICFIFGGTFLKGDIVIFGKTLASGAPAFAETAGWDDLERPHNSPLSTKPLTCPHTLQEPGRTGGLDLIYGSQTHLPGKYPTLVLETKVKKRCQPLIDKCFLSCKSP